MQALDSPLNYSTENYQHSGCTDYIKCTGTRKLRQNWEVGRYLGMHLADFTPLVKPSKNYDLNHRKILVCNNLHRVASHLIYNGTARGACGLQPGMSVSHTIQTTAYFIPQDRN